MAALVLAAIVAGCVVVATLGQVISHWREAAAEKKAFEKYRLETESRIAEADAKGKAAAEHAAKLAVELEEARNAAKQIDANLLHEQRLTANERWRLARLEYAVFPRVGVNPDILSAALKESGFSKVDLAILNDEETLRFGASIEAALAKAGLLGDVVFLELEVPELGPPVAPPSFLIVGIDEEGRRLADFFFQKFQIGQGWLQPATQGVALPYRGLLGIPTKRNTIVIGKRELPQFVPIPGQPGEGLDERGRPVPFPQ